MTSKIASWSQVKLGKVLTYIDQLVDLDDEVEYTTITVKRRHGGLEAREKLFGSQIRTKKQFRLISGAFIISRVQCWHQAYAIVPETIEQNMIASANYDQFIISPEVDKRFFWWLSYSPIFTEIVRSCAFGVVIEKMVFNRNAWLDKTISIPPLSEQRRIVERIEELAVRIEEARELRHRSVDEVGSLEVSAAREVFTNLNGVNILPLRELVTMYGGGTPSKLNPTFWLGTIPWISPKDMKVREISNAIDHISEEAIESSPARLIDPGTVLIVTRGMILAHTVPSAILRVQATINQDMKALVPGERLLPEYLCNTLWALNEELLKLVEKSTHDTRKLESPKLLEFKIPVPSLSEQQLIIAYLDNLQFKANCLKQLQAETSAELDALLPSILDKAFKGDL
jgi:type I restriction enzyme, S subunit